jgi:multiple sugar transport system ATP-binding protein
MARVILENVNKTYPNGVHAVKDVSLEVGDSELLVLVGPSGCGKSTVLRMIAGLEKVSDGRIIIGDRVVNDLEPKHRDVAMVFQDYALYPHMTVKENLEFGLAMRRVRRQDRVRSVENAARILGLEGLLDRKPAQLSGGQKQRVAVGRAIVREPRVFLFDEPLSNLDAKLRAEMRTEIAKLHQRLGVTTIYVTHDQVEAMTLGHRIVMMDDGTVQQVGSPLEVYNHPVNRFVAGFLGTPPMNFIEGRIDKGGTFAAGGFSLPIPESYASLHETRLQKAGVYGIRPEHVKVEREGVWSGGIKGETVVVEPLGNREIVIVNVGGEELTAEVEPSVRMRPGIRVEVMIDSVRGHLFDSEGRNLLSL